MKIVTAEEMKKIDRECVRRGIPVSVLMENAGKAVAEETIKYLGKAENQNILCLIGAGNNGGDGLVAARILHEMGARVTVYICATRPDDDANLALVRQNSITCLNAAEDTSLKNLVDLVTRTTCVIDALLGTGRVRPLEGIFRRVLEKINSERKKREFKVIAVDLPSGMDADTGAVDPVCIRADLTVTLAFPKLGLFNFPGAEMTGQFKIVNIGIPASLTENVTIDLITADWARSALPERSLDANKGSFGRVLVAGGSVYYIGAAYLACSGAMRVGTGLVTLATAHSLQPILASKLTETTYIPLPESKPGIIGAEAAEVLMRFCPRYNVLLFGCGLGQDPATVEFVSSLIFEKDLPLPVLDADALNILPQIPEWSQWLTDDAILTPHPGEMSRLCGLTIEEIQADRLNIARRYAAEWHQTIVLKGAYTVVANTDGRCRVSPFANPGLASAGTGDVLAGCIAGMVAQGVSPFDAASLGVYLHGAAGEIVKQQMGDTGMIASDLLPAIPLTIKQLKNGVKQE